MLLTLTSSQIDTRRIFIGIQHARLPSRQEIDQSYLFGELMAIPVRFIGQWEILVARVQNIAVFHEGTLLSIDPRYEGSVLQNWPSAWFWIPSSRGETAGVLNYTGPY